MKNAILFLRISFWWGIIADGVMAFLMLFPNLYVRFTNLSVPVEPGLRIGLQNAAPLMIGWTILLFWAQCKPLERKEILLLTLPVIAGYCIIEVEKIVGGTTSWMRLVQLLVMQILMSSMFVFSYVNARKFSPGREEKK